MVWFRVAVGSGGYIISWRLLALLLLLLLRQGSTTKGQEPRPGDGFIALDPIDVSRFGGGDFSKRLNFHDQEVGVHLREAPWPKGLWCIVRIRLSFSRGDQPTWRLELDHSGAQRGKKPPWPGQRGLKKSRWPPNMKDSLPNTYSPDGVARPDQQGLDQRGFVFWYGYEGRMIRFR